MKVYLELDIKDEEVDQALSLIKSLNNHCKNIDVQTDTTKFLASLEKVDNLWSRPQEELLKDLNSIEKTLNSKISSKIATEFYEFIIQYQFNPHYDPKFVFENLERFCKITEKYNCVSLIIPMLLNHIGSKNDKVTYPNRFILASQTLSCLINLQKLKSENIIIILDKLFNNAKETPDYLGPSTLILELSKISLPSFNQKILNALLQMIDRIPSKNDEFYESLKKNILRNIALFCEDQKSK